MGSFFCVFNEIWDDETTAAVAVNPLHVKRFYFNETDKGTTIEMTDDDSMVVKESFETVRGIIEAALKDAGKDAVK